jgi:hypothetical protein
MAYTAEQMVEELWERIGEPSDLDPYDATGDIDTTSDGWSRMLRALNRGIASVASFRDPQTGRLFRFRDRHAWQYVTFTPSEDTTDAAITAGDQTVQFTGSGTADTYNDYLVKVGNEVRTIVDDDGAGTCTVNKSFDAAHASGVAIYYAPRYVTIDTTTTKFVEVLGVYNMEERTELIPGTRGDVFANVMNVEGDPRYYYRVGSTLYFDVVQFDDTQRFRIEYLQLPDDMSATTDTSGLPEAFDEAIVMWAVAWGFGRILDPQKRAAARSEFVAEMRMHQSEWHIADEMNPHVGGYVRID